ncbi:MAG: hypothetical protein KDA62_17455 [Planctomycetales bacterium]|nr:hypothetical protein [Planctomycetales bacterium]
MLGRGIGGSVWNGAGGAAQPQLGASQPHEGGASHPQAGGASQPQAGASQPHAGGASQPQAGASQPQAGAAQSSQPLFAQPRLWQTKILFIKWSTSPSSDLNGKHFLRQHFVAQPVSQPHVGGAAQVGSQPQRGGAAQVGSQPQTGRDSHPGVAHPHPPDSEPNSDVRIPYDAGRTAVVVDLRLAKKPADDGDWAETVDASTNVLSAPNRSRRVIGHLHMVGTVREAARARNRLREAPLKEFDSLEDFIEPTKAASRELSEFAVKPEHPGNSAQIHPFDEFRRWQPRAKPTSGLPKPYDSRRGVSGLAANVR